MTLPLMPKATAVWLVDNTALTFEQIADFCGMHSLEVQGIADGEVARGIIGIDPIAEGQITEEDLKLCEQDASRRLSLTKEAEKHIAKKQKGARYTPVSRRHAKPDAVAWILKNHPDVTDAQIVKLIGTTKNTIKAIRERSHWNTPNLKPRDPVLLGLCSQTELDRAVERARLNSPRSPSAPAEQVAPVDFEDAAGYSS